MRPFVVLFAAVAAASLAAMPTVLFAQAGAPPPTNAASSPLVRLAPRDAQTLARALRSVSEQTGIAFVAEGKPFRVRNAAPPLAPLAEKWPVGGVPLGEAVQKIAGAYDYEAERQGGVFLLRKRYTRSDDLPDVTAEELRLALRDASRAASALPPPTVPPADANEANSPFMASLFKTLPPDTQAQFTSPKSETSISGNSLVMMASPGTIVMKTSYLTNAQKESLWQCAVSRHMEAATGGAMKAYQALLTVEQKDTFFQLADGEPKAIKQAVLAYSPAQSRRNVFPSFAPAGKITTGVPLPADYGANGAREPWSDPAENADTQTLQDLCRSGFAVDDALLSKTVLVVAPQSVGDVEAEAMREAVFRAAGAVYGLRVLHGNGNTWRISRARVSFPTELSGLNTAVLLAFPVPLLRAFRGVAAAEEAKERARYQKIHENEPGYDPKKPSTPDKISAKYGGRSTAQHGLQNTALHRFRVLVEPHLADGKTLSTTALDDEARQLLTLVFACDCINDVDNLNGDQQPPTRKGLEKGFLFGSCFDDLRRSMDKTPAETGTPRRFGFSLSVSGSEAGGDTKSSLYSVGNVTFPAPPTKPSQP